MWRQPMYESNKKTESELACDSESNLLRKDKCNYAEQYADAGVW